MEKTPKFTLAWVTCAGEEKTKIGAGSKILFVRHPKRGWEIPGGHLMPGESPENAIIRELKEETGCDGKLVAWNKVYYPEGWVGHVVVNDTNGLMFWDVEDANVSEVRWWKEIPPLIEWTREEFQDLSEWCLNL
tara:strand:- start:287 stop:688 length:402 start_codon:yes stop_codon:yes gene_type:complete